MADKAAHLIEGFSALWEIAGEAVAGHPIVSERQRSSILNLKLTIRNRQVWSAVEA